MTAPTQPTSPKGNPICPGCDWPVMPTAYRTVKDGLIWHRRCEREART